MNYFELFDLPVTLLADKKRITSRYFELQKKFHTDFYTGADNDEQSDVLEKSAQVNKAYKIFSNSDETIKYVLQLKGLLEEEEKYTLSPDFLMEMLDLNEEVADARMDENEEKKEGLKASISNIQSDIYGPVKKIVEEYKEGITTEKELLQVKEYYYRKKYLNRILEGLD